MLNAIIAFSLRRRLLILMLTAALVAGGVLAFSRLPIDAVPDITNNQVQVLTKAPALSALEMERFVSFPIEIAVKSLPDLVEVRSLSRAGLSVVTVVFEEDVDIYFGRQLILEKLRGVEGDLPDGVERPELGPVSTGLGEIFRYVVRDTTGRRSLTELRTIQDWIIRRQLLGAEALAEVNSLGGYLKQYQVLVDPDKLAGYNLTLRQVLQAAGRAGSNAGGAYIETGPEQLAVRAVGLVTDLDDIRSTVLKVSDEGTPVTLGDIADVQTGPAVRFGSASQDGEGEVVVGIVMQLKGANARVTVNAVKERIEEIRNVLPEGVVIEPYYDREELVDRTIRTVILNLAEGALLVVGVLLLLLVSIRAGLIVASVIPLSMMFAGIMMYLTGQSGNLMSLGAIDFGLVVDGSLIIVENVLRLLERYYRDTPGRSLTPERMKTMVYDGAVEVRKAAQFGEIIIIVVYLPIITLQGIEGKLFRPMALTVGYALIGALILSITYVPVLCSYLLRGQKKVRHSPVIEFLRRIYRPALAWALGRRMMVGAVALLLVAGALVGFSRLGGEFIPRLDEGDIAMHLIRLPSVSLTESQELTTEVERILTTFPEVKTVVSHTGRAEVSTDPMGFELADVFIILKHPDEWTTGRTKQELIEEMDRQIKQVPGVGVQFLQPIEMRMNELIAGARGDVVIKVFGEDYGVLQPAADRIAALLRDTRGAADVTVEQTGGLPQLIVQPDRAAIARYGMTVDDINQVVETAIGGATAGVVYEGEKRFDLVVRYRQEARSRTEAIRSMLVATPTGQRVPLSSLASVTVQEGPTQISRREGSRYASVQANVRDRDVRSFVEEVRDRVAADISLPPGYRIVYGGQFENLEAAAERLTIIVPVALLLIFMLLYQTFGSLRHGVMIFLCIPAAVVGGVAALMIAGLPFSISAGVGFIALFGIAVLNGIVMVAAIRKHQSAGLPRRQAILTGADERLRPVITTAALAGFGFLPMMLAQSAGAEVQRPLATVVVGGLISSTLLTLFLLPVIYDRFGGSVDREDASEGGSGTGTKGGALAGLVILLLLLPGSMPATAQTTLTFDAAMERITANAPDLEQAGAAVEQQRAAGTTARLLPPTEFFFGVEEYPTGNLPGEPTIKLGIGQSLEFPAVYGARRHASNLQLDAAEAHLKAVRRHVRRKGARAWWNLVQTRAGLALSDSAVAVARRFAEAVGIRRRLGEIDELEKAQADLALANAEQERETAEGAYQEALARIRVLMGAGPQETFRVETVEPAPGADFDPTALQEALRRNHPQLQAADRAVEAADARRSAVAWSGYPGISLELERQTVEGFSGYYGGRIGLDVHLSRWLSGGPDEEAEAELLMRNAAKRMAELELTEELKRLYAAWQSARERLHRYDRSFLPAAEKAGRIALRLYQEGEAGYLEVLAAQATLIETRRRRMEVLYRTAALRQDIEILTEP